MIRLKRIEAGRYETPDGKYEIVNDPTGGRHNGGWEYTSWLVFEKDGIDPLCSIGNAGNVFATLREARAACEAEDWF